MYACMRFVKACPCQNFSQRLVKMFNKDPGKYFERSPKHF